MTGEEQRPIIVIRKKVHAHGHHGGAWKVAYADFVTAMMAFFMVLWLMNSSEKVQEAVGAYFRDPTGRGKQSGSSVAGSGAGIAVTKDDMAKLKDKLSQAMSQMPAFQQLKDQVSMTVTGEGLRVEMIETESGMFFDSGSPKPSYTGEEMLVMLARELGQLPNELVIEGHTDSKPYTGATQYGNWELSTERANSSRRLMEVHGLRSGQVVQVRGFADRELRMPGDPTNASNRRISVIVKYLDPPAGSPTGGSGPNAQSPVPEAVKPAPAKTGATPKTGGH